MAASGQERVAVFSRQGQLADARLQPGVLLREPRLSRRGLRGLDGCGRMGQPLLAPLVGLGRADLRRTAEVCDRRALEPLKHDAGFGGGLPLASFPG